MRAKRSRIKETKTRYRVKRRAHMKETIPTASGKIDTQSVRLDKTAFSIALLSDSSDERAYWLARTPQERLRQIEMLRRINYGHGATARLQRVLEITQLKPG